MSDATTNPDLINITIDGQPVAVPKGTNIINAAKTIGIDIPHYCYHKNLSVVGNCRMCQIEVKGAPKLDIACNCAVREGMEVKTHLTSPVVKDAQAATLEFILINHPLDCTVCDQAGHCKLQDYHYDYNARPSRFLEKKEHKVKAEPLGPNVILDGERCIMCTRCIRFCDEVTGTSELGMLNRGDRSVIAINPEKPLDNALSGTVVDLCPVGALTHRQWRFNTRIWFTKQTESICTGCSTGCNVKVAARDGQIVQVKAKENQAVNKEWLCDEGRYGFNRFLPKLRQLSAKVDGKNVELAEAIKAAKKITSGETIVFLSPDLLLEEYALVKKLCEKSLKNTRVVVAYKERTLDRVEAILKSPDYAANFRAAEFAGLVSGNLQENYQNALADLKAGKFNNIFIFGDRGILVEDQNSEVTFAISKASYSLVTITDSESSLADSCKIVLPARSILEKSGLMINRGGRLQYLQKMIEFPDGTFPDWKLITMIAAELNAKISAAGQDRDLTLEYLSGESRLSGLSIANIKKSGVCQKAALNITD